VISDPTTARRKTRMDATRLPAQTSEDGQTMVEYAVVLGVITLAIVTGFAALSGSISDAVSAIAGRV
jgi:Flp pilus assembly pilin Flp